MKVSEVKNRELWDDFFNKNGSPSFLQSWEWGEFQKKIGYQIFRLGIYDNNQLLGVCLVIKIKAKRGEFLFAPHGPIIKSQISKIKNQNYILKIKNYLTSIAIKEKYSFIRIAPILESNHEDKKIFQNLGFKTAPIYMHAETVWQLPLNNTEEGLLSSMRKTTRYLIKKAIRDGVLIEKRTDAKAVDDFYKIYQETAQRENFIPFSKDYIKKEFEEFNKTGNALFLFAKFTNNNLAAALILFTKSTTFYHQGASYHTKIPATYLLQWEAIRQAKKRGCQFYNFWGIYDEETNRMPKAWTGLTLFKTGFGGNKISYLPTQDYVISLKYYLSYIFETILNWRRGVGWKI